MIGRCPRWFSLFLLCLSLTAFRPADAATSGDAPPAGGHPFAEALAGSRIVLSSTSSYEVYDLPLGEVLLGENGQYVFTRFERLEGAVTRLTYMAPDEATPETVYASYRELFRKKGFETLYAAQGADFGPFDALARAMSFDQVFWSNRKERRFLVGKLERPEGPVYLAVYAVRNDTWGPDLRIGVAAAQRGVTYYRADIVEVRPREGGFMVMKACDIAHNLNQKGKAAIYALRFDSEAATVRRESAAALREIADLMTQSPELRLFVVGHVAGDLDFEEGMRLSRLRAEAVVNALVSEYGVGRERLEAYGVGMLAPLVTNENEEGQARNERIELVKR